ncbi:unnamed protein product (macronuclear) [Paramecium tetraurelia]|uniref:Leucine rich repeat protein n=1 Tax=Paramecium tetraurelia TaxID=5888 RepID=A0DVV4_PARTE|nr:uncharacterized protein GSPATT00020824001 [Paramecium tetraurelia]CAK87171.1 unnamed protein product [Paramecium tetraurelia]|eukprot:XP_001454568.1 hypothetical protein (macronuclear) [Paramecium tetraurelia strain d4-2]
MRGNQKQQQQVPIPSYPFPYSFWSYNNFETKELEAYLSSQSQTLQTQIPKTCIQDGYQQLCKILNQHPHPVLHAKQAKQQQQITNLLGEQSIDSIKNTSEITQFLVFQNTQIDAITLILLQFLWPLYQNLNVFKLYNIKFSETEMEILQKIIENNKLIKVFIEYTNIIPQINCPTLTQLYLRGNQITQSKLNQIFQPGTLQALQVIELSDNPLGKDSIQILANFMSKKNSVQYIGLSRCEIAAWEDLKPLIETIGPEKLNEAKLQAYRELEEKRDKQIKDQLKAKKKEVVAEIELEPLTQNADGSYSIIHNQQLQILFLAVNPFKDSDKDQIERFIQANPNVYVVLQGCSFETKTKERLKKRYNNIVF